MVNEIRNIVSMATDTVEEETQQQIHLDVTGNVQLGDKFVCVMLAKKDIKENGECTGDEDFGADDGENVKREMENGLAQAAMAMEIINTYAARTVVVFVSNYREWLFIKTGYDAHNERLLAMVHEDKLILSESDIPKVDGMARIA
ncbi:hypothetical protein JG688_00010382 [Phytophthora aleatoria]|uniref:Uncharacterized protein n=1 Tax=Phytophthora aleatoria TaxID=2496075 RepID=A0A8J5M1Q7_9STRA|nr:hypothetical protein JG688_00010382 [Phytophthora aleatoria]